MPGVTTPSIILKVWQWPLKKPSILSPSEGGVFLTSVTSCSLFRALMFVYPFRDTIICEFDGIISFFKGYFKWLKLSIHLRYTLCDFGGISLLFQSYFIWPLWNYFVLQGYVLYVTSVILLCLAQIRTISWWNYFTLSWILYVSLLKLLHVLRDTLCDLELFLEILLCDLDLFYPFRDTLCDLGGTTFFSEIFMIPWWNYLHF